jgi:hypothetical protein
LSGFLLDTNVLSEPTKKRPNPGVIEWLETVSDDSIYVSVISLGEIRRGIDRLASSKKKATLERFLLDLNIFVELAGFSWGLGPSEAHGPDFVGVEAGFNRGVVGHEGVDIGDVVHAHHRHPERAALCEHGTEDEDRAGIKVLLRIGEVGLHERKFVGRNVVGKTGTRWNQPHEVCLFRHKSP